MGYQRSYRKSETPCRTAVYAVSQIKQAYDLGIALGDIFNKCKDKKVAFTKLGLWHNQVENAGIASFESVARSIAAHHRYYTPLLRQQNHQCLGRVFQCKTQNFQERLPRR